MIDATGPIEGASGNLADCMHVDGTSGPRGTGSDPATAGFADGEIPGGTVDGSNVTFTLANTANPTSGSALFGMACC